MDSKIQELNGIMNPYFELKQKFENKYDQSKLQENIDRLEDELKKLRVDYEYVFQTFSKIKEEEIKREIQSHINSKKNSYFLTLSILKKELENKYDNRFLQIKNEFSKRENVIVSSIQEYREKIDRASKYSNEDLIKLFDLKAKTKGLLISFKFKLESELASYKNILNELEKKSLEFQKGSQVSLNGEDWRSLCIKKQDTSDIVLKISLILKQLDGYLSIVEPKEEETSVKEKLQEPIEILNISSKEQLLPNGDFITDNEIIDAIKRNQGSGRKYKISNSEKRYKISIGLLKEYNDMLRDCSLYTLVDHKILSVPDVYIAKGKCPIYK